MASRTATIAAHLPKFSRFSFVTTPWVSHMETRLQQTKGWGGVPSSLDPAIEVLNLAKELSGITPAKAVFGSVAVLLTMIRVCFHAFCNE